MFIRRTNAMRLLALTLAFLAPAVLAGKPPAHDKRGDDLFHPTPREAMRELSTDRPDKTESPFTVDAGHVQIETDLAAFTYDRHNVERADRRVEAWSFAATNVKLGLCSRADLQIVIEPYATVRTSDRASGATTRQSGFGDLTVRTKINLWGNDGGTTACAVMPFVKLPTNQDGLGNRAVEGGIIVPLAVKLPRGWDLGLMTEVDFLENSTGRGHHAEWVNTITLGHALTKRLGAYVEFFSAVTAEPHQPWVGTFDVGFTFALTDDIQLDCGANFGLTRSADDVAPFVGITWRF